MSSTQKGLMHANKNGTSCISGACDSLSSDAARTDAPDATVDAIPVNQRLIQTDMGEMNELESMCPRCHENGTTRLMMINIPHFKDIVVAGFECPHCGELNNEVMFGGAFGPKKVRYELQVTNQKDLDRQVVKSEFATLTIPKLQLEIPPESQKGALNTVEGVLRQVKANLELQQSVRRITEPELFNKIDIFCTELSKLASGSTPFTFILSDPAGNSYIESFASNIGNHHSHTMVDNQLRRYEEERTDIDRQLLGLEIDYNTGRTEHEEKQVEDGKFEDVHHISTNCPACQSPGNMNVKQCDIPHFQETVIMSFKCDVCGYRTTDIKNGGPISEKGLRLTLHVEDESDLSRDVLKSETATLHIPEISLELAAGTLGGFFSTVEGILTQVSDQLRSLPQVAFVEGDSSAHQSKTLMTFVHELNDLIAVKRPFTFILDDPLANVYIQNPRAHLPPPDNLDPRLAIEEYTRTAEQEEELAISTCEHKSSSYQQ